MNSLHNEKFKIQFKHNLLQLVIPIALQNLISATVMLVDVFMLGIISQNAMASVSLASQITFILSLFYFGLSAGAGILAAQYWGKKDIESISRVLSVVIVFALSISICFSLISLVVPQLLMRLFTNDIELIKNGVLYLRPIAITYITMSMSQMYLSILRSTEKTKISSYISSSSLIINVLLDSFVIMVLFKNQPEKAILGVAWATVISRFFELFLTISYSIRKHNIHFHLPYNDQKEKMLRKDFIRYTIPVISNYLVWGVALAVTSAIIGHVNADMVAANSLTSVIRNLSAILYGGIGSGGAILIGKYLGNHRKDLAKYAAKKVITYSIVFSILAGLIILLISPFVVRFVTLNENAKLYLTGMLIISSYYSVGKAINSTIIGGIFPAGGDSKFGFYCDTIVMWGIILPLSFVAAFVLHLSPIWIYFIISLDELIKIPIAFFRYRKYKWLNNITREFTELQNT